MWTSSFQVPPDFWLGNFSILAVQVACNSCSSYGNKKKGVSVSLYRMPQRLGVVWYSYLKGAPNQNWRFHEEKLYRMNRGKKTDGAPIGMSCRISCSKCWSTSSGKEPKESEWNKAVFFNFAGRKKKKKTHRKTLLKEAQLSKKSHHQIKSTILRFFTECWGEKEQETTVACLIGSNHLMQSVCNPSLCGTRPSHSHFSKSDHHSRKHTWKRCSQEGWSLYLWIQEYQSSSWC